MMPFEQTGLWLRAFVIVIVLVSVCNCEVDCQFKVGSNGNCSTALHNGTEKSSSQEIITETPKPVSQPKSLNMLAEDFTDSMFRPTPIPTSSSTNSSISKVQPLPTVTATISQNITADEPKGRALNFTMAEQEGGNVINSNLKNTTHDAFGDLSDVSISNEEADEVHDHMISPKILSKANIQSNLKQGSCEKGGLTYENGEKLENGCESVCTCINGNMDCADRCSGPFFRKGKKIEDPLCSEKQSEDPCCSILVCAGDTETEPLEICSYGNKTYNRGDIFKKECTEICSCEAAGKISCKPRCPPTNKTSDRCVEVTDPNDACCKQVLCDVSLDEHEPDKDDDKPKHKLISARFINATTILLKFDSKFDDNDSLPIIDIGDDKKNWKSYQMLPEGLLFVKTNAKYLKLDNTEDIIAIQNTELGPKSIDNPKVDLKEKELKGGCTYKGKTFKHNEEYNDDCESLCVCKNNEMKCLKLECPTYFGVDVMDPNCVEWETVPPNFKPKAPNCCAEKIQCKNNGSCEYHGEFYKNWEQLPLNVTSCEKRCYCEMGTVECQNTCQPVTALPPPTLPCSPEQATVGHLPDDDCCMYWICNPHINSPEIKLNESTNDSTVPQNSTDDMGPFSDKSPSKVLGPLLVYSNDRNQHKNQPKLFPKENPFFHEQTQDLFYPAINDNIPIKNKENSNDNSNSDSKENQYINKNASEFTPPFVNKDISTKTKQNSSSNNFGIKEINVKTKNKSNKSKPSKSGPLFVTPPPSPTSDNPNTSNKEQYPPFMIPQQSSKDQNQIEIHGKGSPEDLLQFINQHPEISNYPSGSVLEIHNFQPGSKPNPQYPIPNNIPSNSRPQVSYIDNQNSISHQINNLPTMVPQLRPQIPYVINPNSIGHQVNDLPPGVSLEHILHEIHKNIDPQYQNNMYPPNIPNYDNNGQLLIAQPSGPIIPTRQNTTYQQGTNGQVYPGNFPNIPNYQQPQDDISVNTLEAIDAHTIRLAFMVPPVIVGLHGRVEVRYTNSKTDDPDAWEHQVFAPPNDLIATPQLEFDLLGLKSDTEYKIKITITLRDLHNTPTSRVYKIKTPKDIQTTTLPPMIPIEPDLAITDINATMVTVVWRKFTEYELQFIDGVQLRFKEIDGKIYAATPLIHRAVTSFTLENLKSNTKYEIGIFFIPFPGQLTELHAENMLHFTTANEIDTYGFNVTLEISQIKSQSVEIAWNGVPYPEDKYVNIYRAIYQSDSGKEDHSTFKIAKRDSPTKTVIMDLKPGTRYRLWLEVYLTNGKIKTSNVQDFITKPRAAPVVGSSSHQDKLARSEHLESRGDYYGPLVIVAILAAIAILSTLILLMILVRRHNQNKAAITPPSIRISQSAYDNPTYKVEIQQETMGL